MSVFESFTLLFASNAEDVQKGAEDAEKAGDKLETKMKKVDAEAKKAGDSFGDLAKKAGAFLLPLVGIAGVNGIAGMVGEFAAGADAAGKLAVHLRMDVEQLQAWQGAATRAGGSADGLAGAVASLNGKLDEVRRTGGGEAAGVLWQLGVQAADSQGKLKGTGDMLLALSDRFQKLNQVQALHFGRKLGLDEGTIALLSKGRAAVEDMLKRQKELGVYTKKDADDARKYNNVMADVRRSMGAVAAVIARALLPMFTAFGEGLTAVAGQVRKHQNLITGFFIALSLVLGVLAVKSAIAFAPFLLFAAVVLALAAAFAILYEDVQAFLDGQDSLIGELSEDYPWLADMVRELAAAFGILKEIGQAVFGFLTEAVADPIGAMERFKATIDPLLDSLGEKFPALAQALRDVGTIFSWLFELAGKVIGAIIDLIWQFKDEILSAVSGIVGMVTKPLSFVAGLIRGDKTDGRQLEGDIAAGKQALAATKTPLAAAPAGGPPERYAQSVRRENNVRIDSVVVHTQATDAQGVAGGMGGALQDELVSAMEHFDDGVAG